MLPELENYFKAEDVLKMEFAKVSKNRSALMELCDLSRVIKQQAASALLSDKSATNEELIKVVQRSWVYRQAAADRLYWKHKNAYSLTKEQLMIMVEKSANKEWAMKELQKYGQ